jgi:hypothetical protein
MRWLLHSGTSMRDSRWVAAAIRISSSPVANGSARSSWNQRWGVPRGRGGRHSACLVEMERISAPDDRLETRYVDDEVRAFLAPLLPKFWLPAASNSSTRTHEPPPAGFRSRPCICTSRITRSPDAAHQPSQAPGPGPISTFTIQMRLAGEERTVRWQRTS